MFLWYAWTTSYPAHAKNHSRKKCPATIRVDEIFVVSSMLPFLSDVSLRDQAIVKNGGFPLGRNMYVCVCSLRTFQGCNYLLLLILSRVMCFHPWSDVTLPLMSIDEILEVIREWIRQFQELSKTYRWVQVVFNLSSLFEWLPDHVN